MPQEQENKLSENFSKKMKEQVENTKPMRGSKDVDWVKKRITKESFMSILIKDTTREERIRILHESLNCGNGGCELCSSCWLGGGSIDDIYSDYIEGRKEISEINMEYSKRMAGRQRG